jgi:CHAD domain-containing protein
MTRDNAAVRANGELVAAISEVLRALDKRPPIPDECVHSARKAIKKARAALRLLREGMDESIYTNENLALRDAGRCLSPLRNAKSLIEAFNALRVRHAAELQQAGYDSLVRHLRAERLAKRRDLFQAPDKLQACLHSLRACRARVSQWQPSSLDPATVAAGLRRIHRAGRKAFAGAREAETPEALHEWRKQVKYLSNALDVLDVSGSSYLAKTEKRTGKLADRLGDDHDLAELARYVAGDAETAIDARSKEVLATLIERRRVNLKKRAYALGAEIYDEKPAHFAARFEES